MKVVCSGCGAEYKIDSTKIKGTKAWFKCKSCSENIIVEKEDILDTFYPVENPAVEDLLGGDGGGTAEQNPDLSDAFSGFDGIDEADGIDGVTEAAAGTGPQNTEPRGEENVQASPAPPKKRHLFGLTANVICLMLLVSLIPGGLYFAISSKYSHDRILNETYRTGTIVTGQLASQVDEWLDKNIRVLKAVTKLPAIQSMEPENQREILNAIQREYPWIYLVFTTDMKGLNIARSDGKPLKNYGDRQYVKTIVNGSDLAWQTLIGKTSKKPALVLAVPVIKDGKPVGLIAAAMTRSAISERVTRFKLGNTGSGFLVDNNGKAVAHQNNAFVLKQKNMSAHPLIDAAKAGRKDRVEFIDADGKTAIGFTAQTAMGWTLAIQQDKDEALAPLKQARKSAILLLCVTLAVVVIIALIASRSLVRPIKELTDAANRISVGDMDVEIKSRSKNEIGDLADAITRLQDSIQISISRLQRLKK
ncbi:MAG: zinc-ribbon domain-containing protein [Desulfobacter sp.]|nr:MAG: zinc-ribbon domain-containing protein [Desulfobacter sp.]